MFPATDLAPDWHARVSGYLQREDVGCVGGSVIHLWGSDTTAQWFDGGSPIAWRGLLGGFHSHLGDLPMEHRMGDVPFLAPPGLATRTCIARRAVAIGIEPSGSDYGIAASFLARGAGLRILYDSRIRAASHHPPAVPGRDSDPDGLDWYAAGRTRVLTLALNPSPVRRTIDMTFSIAVGSRESLGVILGAACLKRHERRLRWTRTVSGKLAGAAEVVAAGSALRTAPAHGTRSP